MIKLLLDRSIAHVSSESNVPVDGAEEQRITIRTYTPPSILRNTRHKQYVTSIPRSLLGGRSLGKYANAYRSAIDVSQDLLAVPERPAGMRCVAIH